MEGGSCSVQKINDSVQDEGGTSLPTVEIDPFRDMNDLIAGIRIRSSINRIGEWVRELKDNDGNGQVSVAKVIKQSKSFISLILGIEGVAYDDSRSKAARLIEELLRLLLKVDPDNENYAKQIIIDTIEQLRKMEIEMPEDLMESLETTDT